MCIVCLSLALFVYLSFKVRPYSIFTLAKFDKRCRPKLVGFCKLSYVYPNIPERVSGNELEFGKPNPRLLYRHWIPLVLHLHCHFLPEANSSSRSPHCGKSQIFVKTAQFQNPYIFWPQIAQNLIQKNSRFLLSKNCQKNRFLPQCVLRRLRWCLRNEHGSGHRMNFRNAIYHYGHFG